MSDDSEYVEGLAIRWAAGDPLESWVIGNDGRPISSAELRNVIDDYLTVANPFPDGMSVETRGVDVDEHQKHAVIVERVAHDEWTVEFNDGAQAWRGHAELRPFSETEPTPGPEVGE